jgi:hypothetical protein
MSEQNAIDAYYSSLVRDAFCFHHIYFDAYHYSVNVIDQTNTWTTLGGPFGGQTAYRSGQNGPYPTSYVSFLTSYCLFH